MKNEYDLFRDAYNAHSPDEAAKARMLKAAYEKAATAKPLIVRMRKNMMMFAGSAAALCVMFAGVWYVMFHNNPITIEHPEPDTTTTAADVLDTAPPPIDVLVTGDYSGAEVTITQNTPQPNFVDTNNEPPASQLPQQPPSVSEQTVPSTGVIQPESTLPPSTSAITPEMVFTPSATSLIVITTPVRTAEPPRTTATPARTTLPSPPTQPVTPPTLPVITQTIPPPPTPSTNPPMSTNPPAWTGSPSLPVTTGTQVVPPDGPSITGDEDPRNENKEPNRSLTTAKSQAITAAYINGVRAGIFINDNAPPGVSGTQSEENLELRYYGTFDERSVVSFNDSPELYVYSWISSMSVAGGTLVSADSAIRLGIINEQIIQGIKQHMNPLGIY
jgi:hypothetical protein